MLNTPGKASVVYCHLNYEVAVVLYSLMAALQRENTIHYVTSVWAG